MPSFIKNTSGGKAISGGALAPRSRRGNNTNQVASYWSGGGPSLPNLEFFVVAGGGGGGAGFNNGSVGGNGGSGGGGGGSIAPLTAGVAGTYTITVGAGGNGGPYPSAAGAGGSSSIVNPSSATVVSATGGGAGASNTHPSSVYNGGGGTGTSWNGGSGNSSGGTTSTWTGTSVTYSYSGTIGVGNYDSQPGNEGRGGNSGGGNPFSGSFGQNGGAWIKILTADIGSVKSTTGSVTTYTSGSYTYYKWTGSGTLVLG